MIKKYLFVVTLPSLVLLACGQNEAVTDSANVASGVATPIATSPSQPVTVTPPGTSPIHSNIDFSVVKWPASMTPQDQRALELALNITGSFEGLQSWINISTNADGQGMSLGLLSQNFGSGTLQPLLIKMRDQNPTLMAKIFSQSHLLSLYAMLADWQGKKSAIQTSSFVRVAKLDSASVAGSELGSVNWASQNLYSNGQFIPQWKSEFQTMAQTAEYINLQIVDALIMHASAKAYAARIGVPELRNYLMAFDIVDEDGNIPTQDFNDYATYLSAHPKASHDDMLIEILNLRLRHVLPAYVEDVRSRKMAIINGQGVVHGSQRYLEKEFLFNRLVTY